MGAPRTSDRGQARPGAGILASDPQVAQTQQTGSTEDSPPPTAGILSSVGSPLDPTASLRLTRTDDRLLDRAFAIVRFIDLAPRHVLAVGGTTHRHLAPCVVFRQ